MGRPNVTWTPLFKGSDVATNIDKAFTGTREQVWLIWVPVGVDPGFVGCKSVDLTSEP